MLYSRPSHDYCKNFARGARRDSWQMPGGFGRFAARGFSKSYDIFETPGLTQVPAPARLASACKHCRGNFLSS